MMWEGNTTKLYFSPDLNLGIMVLPEIKMLFGQLQNLVLGG